jgi:hypothetical protein
MLFASEGDPEPLRQLLIPNNTRWSPEEMEAHIQRAVEAYKIEKAELDKKNAELHQYLQDQEVIEKARRQRVISVRWGLNKRTGEWWLTDGNEGRVIHPEMYETWTGGDYTQADNEDFAWGYAEYDPEEDSVVAQVDDSIDMNWFDVLTDEEEYDLEMAIKQWYANGIEKDLRTMPKQSSTAMYRVGDPVVYHGDWDETDRPTGTIMGVTNGFLDWQYTVKWDDGDVTKEYEYAILPNSYGGNPLDQEVPDFLPWDDDEQNYYRTSATDWSYQTEGITKTAMFSPTIVDERGHPGEDIIWVYNPNDNVLAVANW